ncbi:PAS domain-containing protein [Pseudomonas sp. S36]|nr:PAS domain-containing protein [Pseudomonas sp. S36]
MDQLQLDDDGNNAAERAVQNAMLNATPDCVKILAPDGTLLAMNRAGCAALGIPAEQVKGLPWVPLLPVPVQPSAQASLQAALAGQVARFSGLSASAQRVFHWDNLLTPVTDLQGQVVSVHCVSRDVTEQTLLRKELDMALEREQLLSREMLHRIQNLLSVVQAVVSMADREARATAATDSVASIVNAKLGALSRAYGVILDNPDGAAVDLALLAGSVLSPYVAQCRISGPGHPLPARLRNTLALCIHELATNSIKYGALGAMEGLVHFQWSIHEQVLQVDWCESGGPEVSADSGEAGFGTTMIERLARAAGGEVTWNWRREGLVAHLKLPLAG